MSRSAARARRALRRFLAGTGVVVLLVLVAIGAAIAMALLISIL